MRVQHIHLWPVPLVREMVEVEWRGATLIAASRKPLRDAATALLFAGVSRETEVVAMNAAAGRLHWRGTLRMMQHLPEVYDRGLQNRDEDGLTHYQRMLMGEGPISPLGLGPTAEEAEDAGGLPAYRQRPPAGSAGPANSLTALELGRTARDPEGERDGRPVHSLVLTHSDDTNASSTESEGSPCAPGR